MLTQTKISNLEKNLVQFKSYVELMRDNSDFDFSKLRRKIRAFVKTTQIGDYYRITLKHSTIGISFTHYFNQQIFENVFTIHFCSKFPMLDKMVIHAKNDKEFLEKILFDHKLFDHE